MSQFSRRARWLTQLFTQSVAPAKQDPSQLSDDVSLVQPYDGSGWAIEQTSFPVEFDTVAGPLLITEPFVGIMDFTSKVGITTVSDLFSISNDLVARILQISDLLIGGIGAENTFYFVAPPNDSGVSNHIVMMSGSKNIVPSQTIRQDRALFSPIMLPGTQLSYFFTDGDVSSETRISVAMVIAPVGTVFYL